MKKALWLMAALSLTACAATGPATYGPATDNGFGYSQTQIESNRIRIVYRGSGGMPPELVEDFALRRAGELTLDNGYDWFEVISREIVGDRRGGVSIGAGVGSGSYGRRSGVSVGVGGNLGEVGGQDYFTVLMEVLMGTGEPPNNIDAYDARDVLATLAG